MRNPRAIAAAFVVALDRDMIGVGPQRDGAALEGVDVVNDRHEAAAAEAGRHLGHDGIDRHLKNYKAKALVGWPPLRSIDRWRIASSTVGALWREPGEGGFRIWREKH